MAKSFHTVVPNRYQRCQATGLYKPVGGATHDKSGKRLTHSHEPGARPSTKRQERYSHWVANGYDGVPLEFHGLRRAAPEYNMASTGEREKAPLRSRVAKAKESFAEVHEGPREKVGTPEKHLILTPRGNVEREVHAQQDQEAAKRNREKDAQMQAWRGIQIGTTRKFNTRTLRPEHLRERVTPEVLREHGRHHDQSRGQGR